MDGHAIDYKERIKLFTGGHVNNSNVASFSTKGIKKTHFVKVGYVCPFLEKNAHFISVEFEKLEEKPKKQDH